MYYPTLTPENVSRDFIDVFGGYNHNLRIGDNEFYDMKNMSSSCYPLLATRQKRGEVPSGIANKENVVGMLYRSALYYVTARWGESQSVIEPLTLYKYKDGRCEEVRSFPGVGGVSTGKRTLIMMGAYMLIFPDKVYVNLTDADNDYGSIEREVTTTGHTVTIRPCLADGSVINIDYVGDKSPSDYSDGYVWVDTSVDPASVKRYNQKDDVWVPVLYQYIRLTGDENTHISSGFEVGDGIQISGVSIHSEDYDLNGISILREKPDDNSLVVSGVFTNDNIKVFEQINDRENFYNIRVFCDSSVKADDYKNKTFIIGNKEYVCQGNTAAAEYEYWIDRDWSMSSFQADYLVVETTVAWPLGNNSKTVTVERRVSSNITESILTADDEDNIYVKVGNQNSKFNVFKYTHSGSTGEITLTAINGSHAYLKNSRISKGTKIYPIIRGDSKGLYETTLTFVAAGTYPYDKLAIKPDFVVNHTAPITFARKMPIVDDECIIESKNRIWACRYGKNADGDTVNEIYASKLGDFKNWQCFESISTDSYAASCGTDGKWTGAVNYLGYPVFFKENYIHTVYGNYPAQFQINSVAARGVKEDCTDSLAILNEVLYYMSTDGVCAYNGSLPTNISSAFGEERYDSAVACTHNGKYYIRVKDPHDNPILFVYDAKRSVWHKEDDLDADFFCSADNDLYYVDGKELGSMFGTGGVDPAPVQWYVETGLYGLSQIDSKYISKLNLRLSLETKSNVIVSIRYDSSGVWERLCNIVRPTISPFTLPIKPRRCDHFQLRLEGSGGAKIYSISKTIEQGSDK